MTRFETPSIIVAIAGTIEETDGEKNFSHALENNKIVTSLDKGWIKSAKIYDSFTKHYYFDAGYDIKRYNDPNPVKRGEDGS